MQQNYETFGNYILLEKLASGGMAEVYLAKKIAASGVQKFVAIKRILAQFSDSEDFIQMFKDEAKIAINLSHSNVVSIYDFGMQDGQFFIVMEFVEGRNLRQVLNRMKKDSQAFSVAQVVHIVKQVSSGLDHAHRCIDPTTGQPLNIIHRDMSPQNVMLSFEGEAKVVDFGIAKAETQIESTRAGTLKGKFGYMSPEQVEGQVIDSRTDIFALGIMLWEMLANQRLFLANNELNTLRKIRECNITSLQKLNPNIPSELDQITLKALAKDKAQRYQTAADMSRDLQSFLSRFDPDFSTQDFSTFVKSLFSEEIINIRKKQIVYAQVTVAPAEEKMEETEVVTETQSAVAENVDFDDMSLDTITKSKQGKVKAVQPQRSHYKQKVAGLDFSEFEDQSIETEYDRKERLHVVKRNAREKVKNYREKTFTDTSQSAKTLDKKNQDATLLTVIFAASFILVLFAYLNKFHPEFNDKICQTLSSYGMCNPKGNTNPASKQIVHLTSSPSKAAVFVNKKKIGTTPININVKSLPFTLDIRLNGYKDHYQEVYSVTNSLNITLQKIATGILVVRSVGAEIFVNGLKVKSGERTHIPANSRVKIKVMSPITGLFVEKYVTVKENGFETLHITPPTSK